MRKRLKQILFDKNLTLSTEIAENLWCIVSPAFVNLSIKLRFNDFMYKPMVIYMLVESQIIMYQEHFTFKN